MIGGDSIFTIHKVDIEVTEISKPIYLIPFGDIHRYTSLCDVDKWKEFLEWAKAKERAYFLGMGDYDDLASFSERKILQDYSLHESTKETLDEIYDKRAKKLAGEIEFMKGRVIGLIEGNHYGHLQSGTTTTQIMCNELQCKYLGVSSFIRLSFHYGLKKASIDIWAHHGRGASRLVGGSLNTVQQMSDTAYADIYLMGHDHKKSVAMRNRLSLGSGGRDLRLHSKKVLLGRTGSFLRGYVPDSSSYIVRAALSPTDMGVIKIELTPKREQKGDNDLFYVDIHSSI